MPLDSTVSFDEIPYSVLRPQTAIEVAANYDSTALLDYPTHRVIVGVMLPSGTATAGVLYRVLTIDQARTLWGASSIMAQMVAAMLAADPTLPISGVGLAMPNGASAATCTITPSGTVPVSATQTLRLGSRAVQVIMRAGDTPAVRAAAIVAAFNGDPLMPVTAQAAGAVVTLTSTGAGDVYNRMLVTMPDPADGYLPVAPLAITPFTGGVGAPDINVALAAMADGWYTDLACAFDDDNNINGLTANLATRYAASGRRDMHAYVVAANSLGYAYAWGPLSNSKFLSRIVMPPGGSHPWEYAASLCGVASYRLTDDPARQLKGLLLPGIRAPLLATRHSDNDREQLLRNGLSTVRVQRDGSVTLERVITSCQLSAQGVPDRAWLDIMRPKTMSRIRYDWASYLGQVYPRHKLAEDDTIAASYSDVTATPIKLKNSWAARCKTYEQAAWIQNSADTAARSTFKIDPNDPNRVNSRLLVNQVGNLMVFAGRLEFAA